MNRFLKAVFLFLTVGSIALLVMTRHAFYGPHDGVLVRIEKGDSGSAIAGKLERAGAVESASAFLILAKITGASRSFHYGPYLLEKNRYLSILDKIARGETHTIKIAIPEGWAAYQIGERLEKEGILPSAEEFWEHAKKNSLEGRLFPSTYFLEPGMTPESAAQILTGQFRKVFTPEMLRAAEKFKLNETQVLALASIIEREARVDEERAVISSVYHNRLKKGMLLEADPTVQYAMGEGKVWKDRLLYKDLKIDSPYNTYRRRGLPVGPICNPGLKSIEAALNPAQTPYLFFVADGTGHHQFFKDHKSHLEWQAKNRRARKNILN